MTHFHIYLYGRDAGPLATSFEEAANRLQQIDRLFFEPDGSFVWTDGRGQQIDGMLYDAAGKLQYVELRGECRRSNWEKILRSVAGGQLESTTVMKLPNRQWQDLQSFEQSAWPVDEIG